MEYIIGIDSGGTNTTAVAYDTDGNELCESKSGFGNPTMGYDKALAHISESIRGIYNELKENAKRIVIGLAGSQDKEAVNNMTEALKNEFNTNVSIINDTELAIANILQNEDGLLVIAGTGSACFGKKNNITGSTGGWGNLLGDEGSAYRIAISAIQHAISEVDGNKELSELSKNILEYYNIETLQDIIPYIYGVAKDEIAALTIYLSEKCMDDTFKEIIKSEAKLLASQASNLIDRLEFETVKVGLTGGVVLNNKLFYTSFTDALKNEVNIPCEFVKQNSRNNKGGYYISKKI